MADSKFPSYSFAEVDRILNSSIHFLNQDYDSLYYLISNGEASFSARADFEIVTGSLRILEFLRSMLAELRENSVASKGDE